MVSSRARAAESLGFFDGVRAFFGGIGFIVTRPPVWGWALVPVVVATALFVALVAVALWGGAALGEALLPAAGGSGWAVAGHWLIRVVAWAAGIVAAFLIALSLAQPLSGFALDAIAREQELALGGRRWPEEPLLRTTLRSLRVTLTALGLSLPVLGALAVVSLAFPPASVVTVPLKFLVTGLVVAYDFLDYPLGLRGVGVRARLAFVRAHPLSILGFGASAAALLLLPGVGLLVLPFGVAGAARLVVSADRLPAR